MPKPKRSEPRDETEVSCCIKYLVFAFNTLFWVIGCALLGVGLWAWTAKDAFNKLGEATKFNFDPVWFILIIGFIMFFLGFFGCIGSLRENTLLLLIYCVACGIILAVQLAFAILLFVYKDKITDQITAELKSAIVNYRDDADLQNLLDWVQSDWLGCCGIENYNDWDANIYFNCSSNAVEKCGVPFSCCKKVEGETIVNKQCGYKVRNKLTVPNPSTYIYTTGCVEAGEDWLKSNLIPVAAVAVSIALVQILGICFAQNLRHDIKAQRSKWMIRHRTQYAP